MNIEKLEKKERESEKRRISEKVQGEQGVRNYRKEEK